MKAVAGGASIEGITRKENSHEIRCPAIPEERACGSVSGLTNFAQR
jgi:hypothetical protein